MTKFFSLIILLLSAFCALAQGDSEQHQDFMRTDLKIYVVVAVLVIIFAGIITFLIAMDRRLSRLEKTQ